MKESLINAQIFHSAFGAIVVHESQTILSTLDQIKIS